MSTGKTAVLFFSRTLNDEYASSAYGLGYQRFSSLYRFLVNKTLTTVRRAGLPVEEVYSDQQIGQTFGERLMNSLKEVTRYGFTKVIIVGNDAPELTTEDILTADRMLGNQVNVLGRDKRGGAYLIGLNLEQFDLSSLKDIRWQSKDVSTQLEQTLGEVYDLSVKRDINSSYDFYDLLKTRASLSKGVLKFLRKLVHVVLKAIFTSPKIQNPLLDVYLDRGPPSLALR